MGEWPPRYRMTNDTWQDTYDMIEEAESESGIGFTLTNHPEAQTRKNSYLRLCKLT